MAVAGLPSHLTPRERAALVEFDREVRALLGADVHELLLFGSRARGEGHDESDVDVAVVVTPAGRERRREVYDLAFDIQLRLGIDIAPLVVERERLQELRARELLIARDIDRDGIAL